MNRQWQKVLIAALLEVFWVMGLAHAYDVFTWAGTIVALLISNYLMITAAQVLPAGTVYSVFVGLGTAGTVIADILLFGEPFEWLKMLFILFILVGVVGLKLITDEKQEARNE
ncbi:DMT family transporter [Fervidibacillus halotolerans]|uniref:SMR family transporter n=1 Tax=Fervidibacillus halotolerans TaxID=2980027 RepID=A0A9E8RZI7_9BACI|nr:SMR family transporter [Fervidibacillus halotolerans]WAA13184.1 SMR family transporter [Fervidibacillus halotolerans]